MQLKFYSPGEALVAITLLVMHGDGKASIKELNCIIENFCSQPLKLLNAIDKEDKFNFFLEVKNQIFKTFIMSPNTNDTTVFSKEETECLIDAAKKALKPDLRETAFLVAAELAYVDGSTECEIKILDKIKNAFEIENDLAEMILEVVSIKYHEPEESHDYNKTKLPLQFKTITEALIALELAIIFADEDVSRKQEMDMYWNLTILNIFQNKSPEFYYETKYEILNLFNKHLDRPESFSKEEIDNLFSACKNIMGPRIRETALLIILELAYVTGFNEREQTLIDRFILGMSIDKNIVDKISRFVPIKFRV